MGLASFLSRLSKPEPASGPAEEERLRTQARHRLIGAALLVMLAVLLLPWVFDSPPRPLPGDLPIDIPRREAVAALGLPSERTAAPVAASAGPAPDAMPEPQAVRPAPAPPAPARPAAAAAPRETVEAAVPPRRAASAAPQRAAASPAAPRPEPAPASRSAEAEAGAARPAAETAAGARYIVQIGAYADPATARAARLKVERLGLKTYVHEIEVPGGKRIRVRVGPYTDRDEAARVRDRLEKAGFQPGLLTL